MNVRLTGRRVEVKPENYLSNCSPADDALGESTSTRRLHIFYEPACQVSSLVVAASYLQRQTSSERAQAPQPAGGCARERLFNSDSIVKRSIAARLIPARPLILLFALSCGTLSCRRTIRSEGGAALSVGRLSRAAKCPRALAPSSLTASPVTGRRPRRPRSPLRRESVEHAWLDTPPRRATSQTGCGRAAARAPPWPPSCRGDV